MREEVVLEAFHLWCLLQDRQGIVILDTRITNPISWKLVFFARNHSVITETSSCIGDTPFCSEECRQEQIDTDEANEKNWNLSSSMKALRKKDQRKSASPTKAQDYPSRTGTVIAA
ncbi:hypothetical protein OIU78_010231 [Salix suchowensis]|uniref:FCS-LIKE ZINC FINGER 1-RELATED n=1 Tax=Salix purpurea TaxID=77065 RepID=A0A9Q0THW6_SALPP|nr:hypothetical protein OIU78_010231 [Salix suchowensis]KAJ6711984.1 FCS-LIKE ZINC FINGER 1-RELATED [Salix purpurea]